jgi:hypothetical protein
MGGDAGGSLVCLDLWGPLWDHHLVAGVALEGMALGEA